MTLRLKQDLFKKVWVIILLIAIVYRPKFQITFIYNLTPNLLMSKIEIFTNFELRGFSKIGLGLMKFLLIELLVQVSYYERKYFTTFIRQQIYNLDSNLLLFKNNVITFIWQWLRNNKKIRNFFVIKNFEKIIFETLCLYVKLIINIKINSIYSLYYIKNSATKLISKF